VALGVLRVDQGPQERRRYRVAPSFSIWQFLRGRSPTPSWGHESRAGEVDNICRWWGAHKRDESSHDPRSIHQRTGSQRDNTDAYSSGAEQTCCCVAVVLLGGGRHVEELQRPNCA
jgi:hypothetical protein